MKRLRNKKEVKHKIKQKDEKKINVLLFLLIVLFSACSKEENGYQEKIVNKNLNALNLNKSEVNNIIKNFGQSLKETTLVESGTFNKDRGMSREVTESNISEEDLNEISDASYLMFENLGFNNDDFYEMFGSSDRESIRTEIAGAAIFLYTVNSIILPEMTEMPMMYNPGSPVGCCFLEVTGIAAGMALVGSVANFTSSGALKSAFIKLMKKLGPKIVRASVGGIGLVLMAAEFSWCMYRQMSTEMRTLTLEDILPSDSYLLDSDDGVDYAYTITLSEYLTDLDALNIISENVYLQSN